MDPFRLGIPELKSGIILLWAIWLSMVTLLNIFDGLKTMKVIAESWPSASGNFAFLQTTTKIYSTPPWLNVVMFVGVIAWEALASWLLWAAWLAENDMALVDTAFIVSLALWGAFILADEFFIAYFVEGEGSYSVAATHRSLFTAFLISLMALHLL